MTETTQGHDARGFTLIELLIVVAIIGTLSALVIPSLQRARMSGNEASAIGTLRAVNSAEAGYAMAAGRGGFASSFSTLAVGCSAGGPGFISPDLATDPSIKSGYTFVLAAAASALSGPDDCNGTPTKTAYFASAVPIGGGMTGQRGFGTTGNGTIFFDASGIPPTETQMADGTGTPVQ